MTFINKFLDMLKLDSTRKGENKEKPDTPIKHTVLSVSEACAMLDRANRLSEIANKTTDRQEFIQSVTEIENILTELSKREHEIDFSFSPSANLKEIRDGRDKQIALLEKRIAEKEKTNKSEKSIEPALDDEWEYVPSKILYVDKHFSDLGYMEVDKRKTIIFNGRNFDIPEVQLCAALLLKFSKNGKELTENKDYPSYYEYKYGLMNVGKLHLWLYENGYLRKATLSEVLGIYKVDELKIMLDSIGLPKTGNKPILIKRIADNIDDDMKETLLNECQKLFLTEKGHYFLDENYDYVLYHGKQYGVQFSEFQNKRILQGRKRKFHDTIFQVLSEKAFVYQIKQWLSQLGWVYRNLSDCLYDEKRYDLSLQNTIYVLYFDANMASLTLMFDIDCVRNNGIRHMIDEINQQKIFPDWIISRIINLQDYFNEQMVDVVYSGNILPYCLFERNECVDFVYDLIENDINFDYYIGVVKNNYKEYIKQFI